MIRAVARGKTGRMILIFGLEPENITRLQDGKPIFIDGVELGADCDVFILAGGSPEEMAEQMGVVLPERRPPS